MSAQTALATYWIRPSITPRTNLNSGFRIYEVDSAEVDSATFDILDAHTGRVTSIHSRPRRADIVWSLVCIEYDTRTTYGAGIAGGVRAIRWWHLVTEREMSFTSSDLRCSSHTRCSLQRWKRIEVMWRYYHFV
ncbi:hypothetical protein V8E53_010363 [Lactarius tabidus]